MPAGSEAGSASALEAQDLRGHPPSLIPGWPAAARGDPPGHGPEGTMPLRRTDPPGAGPRDDQHEGCWEGQLQQLAQGTAGDGPSRHQRNQASLHSAAEPGVQSFPADGRINRRGQSREQFLQQPQRLGPGTSCIEIHHHWSQLRARQDPPPGPSRPLPIPHCVCEPHYRTQGDGTMRSS